MATISNLFVDAGSDYSNIITVSATSGQPLDLSGYTVASQMRKSYLSTTAYPFTASIYNAASGQVRLQLSAATSAQIWPGRYLYDVEITSPSGTRTRVVEGIVTVTPEITQVGISGAPTL
jgi:hypothetical protein